MASKFCRICVSFCENFSPFIAHGFNPFRPSGVTWLHFKVSGAILVGLNILNFLQLGTLVLSPERHSAGMSKN